jgi:hypothetical protein
MRLLEVVNFFQEGQKCIRNDIVGVVNVRRQGGRDDMS